jgi:hypothetical protein
MADMKNGFGYSNFNAAITFSWHPQEIWPGQYP